MAEKNERKDPIMPKRAEILLKKLEIIILMLNNTAPKTKTIIKMFSKSSILFLFLSKIFFIYI